MSDSAATVPVIIGLAIGIGMIALFSTIFESDFILTDDELVSKYSSIAEVSYFLQKYPDANVELYNNPHERGRSILFQVDKQVDPPSYFYTGAHTLGIEVYTTSLDHTLFISCGKEGVTSASVLHEISTIDKVEMDCFQTSYREQQFTIAANRVDGTNLGLRQADLADRSVIEEYWLLDDIISQLDKAGPQEYTVVYKNIDPNQATKFLLDNRLFFMQTCLEIVCYDELSSFINLGEDKSYMIRVFAYEDPFHIVGQSEADSETGIFVPDESGDELMGAVFVEEESEGDTSIEITYNDG